MDKQQAGLDDSMKNKSERLMANSKKLIFVICAALVSTSAVAAVLEEIVVTAQKREQNIQDVGIAITAMTGDQPKRWATAMLRKSRAWRWSIDCST